MNTPAVKLQALSNLGEIWYVAKKIGLEFCLLDGTLLGAYRDKDFCVGDESDIDIGILDKDYDKTTEFIEELKYYGFQNHKVFIIEDKLEGFGITKGENHIDVIRINKHPNRDECYNFGRAQMGDSSIHIGCVYSSKHFDYFDTIRFYGMDFNIPNNVESFLTNQYGDWKTKVHRDEYDWFSCPNLDYDYDMINDDFKISSIKVTAVLVKYQRPDELDAICDHLGTFDFIDEILIRDNTKENLMGYGRYVTAKEAKNNTIYVQDDDCIIDVKKLYDKYEGTKLVNGMKPSGIKAYSGRDSMVGWGTFFEKSWIKVLDRYIDKYGKDDVLIREADRIFTYLLPRETIEMDVKDFPSATSKDALFRQPDHWDYKDKALERLRKIL